MKITKVGGDASDLVSRRGVYVIKRWRGNLVMQAWPRKRNKIHPNQQAGVDAFKRAVKMVRNAPAIDIAEAMDLAANSPFTWRDVLMMAYFGNLYMRVDDQGNTIGPWRYFMSVINDLLNAISDTHGAIIYRNADQWVMLAPGPDGGKLTTHDVGANPTWEQPVATGGAPSYMPNPFDQRATNWAGGIAMACPIALRQNSVVQGFAAFSYQTNAALSWSFALYDTLAGKPHTLLRTVPTQTGMTNNTLHEVALSSFYTVPSDGIYWACLWKNTGHLLAGSNPEAGYQWNMGTAAWANPAPAPTFQNLYRISAKIG